MPRRVRRIIKLIYLILGLMIGLVWGQALSGAEELSRLEISLGLIAALLASGVYAYKNIARKDAAEPHGN